MKMKERIALFVTLLVLVAVPVALIGYKTFYLRHRFQGARVVSLTALASDGVWTEEQVSGVNYWRKRFAPAPEIDVKPGETVVLRLASADVLHSFAIPALGIGPLDVPAGEVREVTFRAQNPGTLLFLCWQVCSPVHGRLRGKIVVLGPNGPGPSRPAPQEPDL